MTLPEILLLGVLIAFAMVALYLAVAAPVTRIIGRFRKKSKSEVWLTCAYIAAFFRATVSLVLAVYAMPVGSGVRIGTAGVEGPEWLFGAGIFAVLGVAVYKRRLWGGYGLILYAGWDAVYKLMIEAFVGAFVGLLWVGLFIVGTFHLARLTRSAPIRPTSRSAHPGNWIRAAWITAFVVCFLGIIDFLQVGQSRLGWLIAACIVGGLGSGILRGDQRCAWALVLFQTLNTVLMLIKWDFSSTTVLVTIGSTAIGGIYAAGAMQLRRGLIHGAALEPTESETWANMVYELAFLHAAWTFLAVLIYLRIPKFSGDYIDPWSLLDAGILAGLGYAAFRRQLWAGYLLILYQILNASASLSGSPVAVSTHASLLVLYGFGVYHLRRLRIGHPAAKPNEQTSVAADGT